MEKTTDLKMPGGFEMGKEELLQIDGGWMRLVYAHLAALAAEAVYEGIDQCIKDFKEGFKEGYNN